MGRKGSAGLCCVSHCVLSQGDVQHVWSLKRGCMYELRFAHNMELEIIFEYFSRSQFVQKVIMLSVVNLECICFKILFEYLYNCLVNLRPQR